MLGLLFDVEFPEELAEENAFLAVHLELIAFIGKLNGIVDRENRETVCFELHGLLVCVCIQFCNVRYNDVVTGDILCIYSRTDFCFLTVSKCQVLDIQILCFYSSCDLLIIANGALGSFILSFCRTLSLLLCSTVSAFGNSDSVLLILRDKVRELGTLEIDGDRNILFGRLELDPAIPFCIRHHEGDIVEQSIVGIVCVRFFVLIERVKISIVGIAFHALCDLGHDQFCIIRNRICILHGCEDNDFVVLISVCSLCAGGLLINECKNGILFQCLKDRVLTAEGIDRLITGSILTDSGDLPVIESRFTEFIGHFIGTVCTLDRLNGNNFIPQRAYIKA